MIDPERWSPDQDPPRDESLGRLLRQADSRADGDVDWDKLRAAVMRGGAVAARGRGRERGRNPRRRSAGMG